MSKSIYWSYVICLIVLRSTSLNLGARWLMPSTNATYPRTKFGTIKIVSLNLILMIFVATAKKCESMKQVLYDFLNNKSNYK